MTRPGDPFDVPVERLRVTGNGRARAAAISLVIVVGGAFAIARLSERGASRANDVAFGSPGPAVAAAASPSPSAVTPRTKTRVERLIEAPDRALPGAPRVRLVQADVGDLNIIDWIAGEGLQTGRTFPGVLPHDLAPPIPVLAPTGDWIVLLQLDESAPSRATASLVDATGRVAWEASDIEPESGALWSTDGSTVVTVGGRRLWRIVTIKPNGRAVERVVRLPGEVFLPSPTFGSLNTPRVDPRTVALGFSADGTWIYGGIVSPHVGTLIGQFRVRVDGTHAEPVRAFGVGLPDGLLPEPGTFGARLVDPVGGRLANWRSNTDTAGGPPTIEVREADSTFAYAVRVGVPLGSGWDAAGALYVLSADSPLYMNRVVLQRIGPDGEPAVTLFEGGPVFSASFLGLRDGYAALGLMTTNPAARAQLVLVKLDQPDLIAATPIQDGPGPAIIGAELVSP